MIKSLTLKQAIAQAFNIDGRTIPEFTSSKPVKEARDWLERNSHTFDYQRGALNDGLVVYSFGGGNPQFTVVDGDADKLKGAQIFASLSVAKKTRKSKSQQRRENVSAGREVNADIDTTQPDIDTLQNKETIVTDPEDSEK